MAEEIRGPVISFPEETLEEGKRSGVATFFLCGEGGRERGRVERNKIKVASYFGVIKFRSYLLYVASSSYILSSQSLMEN